MLQTITDLDLREPTGETAEELSQAHLVHAVWAAMEKIGSKQKQRNFLEAGSSHQMNLRISGDIDGKRFSETIGSVLSIGQDHQKTTSATPQLPNLVAFILSKLNRATRDHILKSVPVDFAENNQRLPEVDEIIVAETEQFLGRLRAAKKVNARGAIRCQYAIQG